MELHWTEVEKNEPRNEAVSFEERLKDEIYEAVMARLNADDLEEVKDYEYAYDYGDRNYAETKEQYDECVADLMEKALRCVLEGAGISPKWISLNEQIPDDDKECLVLNIANRSIVKGTISEGADGRMHAWDDFGNDIDATHWMPLPYFPNEYRCRDLQSGWTYCNALLPDREGVYMVTIRSENSWICDVVGDYPYTFKKKWETRPLKAGSVVMAWMPKPESYQAYWNRVESDRLSDEAGSL